jgi:HD-like signal output (HDOD) protein
MNAVAKLIEYDPGLTVNVLRMANSSFFNSGAPVTNAREALFRLGTRRVVQLAIASGVAVSARAEVKGYGLAEGELLRFSIAVGLAAELAARNAGTTAPDHTFTAGLLCSIGKLVLGKFLEVDAGPILELAAGENVSFEQAERRLLGIDHAELGAMLLARWELPEPIVVCVRWHLDPCSAPKRDLALDLVHVGLVLTSMAGIAQGVDGMQYEVCQESLARVGLTPEGVNDSLAGLVENLGEIEEILSQV